MINELTPKTVFLPVLPLRGMPVFPHMIIHFDVGREKSLSAVEQAMIGSQHILLLAQKDPEHEIITPDSLYTIGTVAKIKQVLKISEDDVRVLVEGIYRAKVINFSSTSPFFECEALKILPLEHKEGDNPAIEEALMRKVKDMCYDYYSVRGERQNDFSNTVFKIEDVDEFADAVAASIHFDLKTKQILLEETDPANRLDKIVYYLGKEIEISKILKNIDGRVKEKLSQNQKEYYLREQIKEIQNELDDGDSIEAECKKYTDKLTEIGAPGYVLQKASNELDRLRKMQSGSGDASVIRGYMDYLVSLPWSEKSDEITDLATAEDILNKDHYGMEKIKKRILEFLAVRILSKGKKSPIICLVGPPGVGKTSVAKSIAKATGRKYVRMPLGGVKDEAEIRGHRKTYIGAMPGRIISAMKQAGTVNPVILLDEIDKTGAEYKGSVSSALLEVLDSEQNSTFRDNYLELEYDLSNVLFITTANSLDPIDRPLLDRMEVIELSGYTDLEKLAIAKEYIIPRQIQENGLKSQNIKITDEAIEEIINSYTRESGVRELERKIEEIMRKAACSIISDGKKTITVNKKRLAQYLGKQIFQETDLSKNDEVGVATGLAWTAFGGDTLSIEVNLMEGTGAIELTGQLGDVMKESAKAAISYIRSNVQKFNIDSDFYKKYDIHIHVPEGAVPKDGPSAGITIATALISALTGRKISKKVAMTGEITITGRILPIGGLKEKSLAAYRAGIETVLIPKANVKDTDDIPREVKEKITFVPVDSMSKVIRTALV